MPNNTFDDYKIAVKNKYEEVRNSEYFVYLDNPTRGRLRNLCWELFLQQNRNQDDLNVFSSLLGLSFDVTKKNKFDDQKDKFRPIETFFKGETDPANVEAVNMAAILVGFEARPFNKFRIHNLYPDEIRGDDGVVLVNQQKGQNEGSGDLEVFLDEKEREKGIEKGIIQEKEHVEVKESEEVTESTTEEIKSTPQAINAFVSIQEKTPGKLNKRIRNTIIGLGLVLFIGFPVIFFAFPNKGCMQWTGNNYEIVDCDLKAADNNIELLDPNLVNLKRIKVCDTTPFFKNEKAIVFYARSGDSLECFNQIGPHPERRSQYLRPITSYMIGKYVSNKPCK
ncbi:MAG: hypothetical protein LDL38_08920 [Flavobacterium piscis]|nr:hypothetical protein [Flavobacterium piscis]